MMKKFENNLAVSKKSRIFALANQKTKQLWQNLISHLTLPSPIPLR